MSSLSKQLKQTKLFGWQASIDGKSSPKMMGIRIALSIIGFI
jgi:hypothetical protein